MELCEAGREQQVPHPPGESGGFGMTPGILLHCFVAIFLLQFFCYNFFIALFLLHLF
jgi:hypothetical protein